MKIKSFMTLALACGLALASASCGGGKKFTDANIKNETLIEKTKSQQMAEAKPAIRAWGEGTHASQSFARDFAENQARGEFGRKLRTLVQTGIRESADATKGAHSNTKKMSEGIDEGILSDAFVQTVSDAELTNVIVINTDNYQLKDKRHHSFVCVEWMGSAIDLADALTRNFEKELGKQLSDEEREAMQQRAKEFRKSIEEQLKRLQSYSAD